MHKAPKIDEPNHATSAHPHPCWWNLCEVCFSIRRKAVVTLTSRMNSLATSFENSGMASCSSSSSPAIASPTKSGLEASACPILTKLGPSRVTARRMCRGAPPTLPAAAAAAVALAVLLSLVLSLVLLLASWSAPKASKTLKASTRIYEGAM